MFIQYTCTCSVPSIFLVAVDPVPLHGAADQPGVLRASGQARARRGRHGHLGNNSAHSDTNLILAFLTFPVSFYLYTS